MKEIVKEKPMVQKITMFVANDGTEFFDREECRKYEESALGVLRSKIAKLIVGKGNAWEVLGGFDDHALVAIKMEKPEDLDTVKQFFLMEQHWYNEEGQEESKNAKFSIMDKAFKNNDYLIFGINSDGNYYFINSCKGIAYNLMDLCNDEEEE
jgi:hypothetical protein